MKHLRRFAPVAGPIDVVGRRAGPVVLQDNAGKLPKRRRVPEGPAGNRDEQRIAGEGEVLAAGSSASR